MQADEALALLDQLLPDHPLNNLQETVFSQVWEGKTYAEIAEACSYEHNYIRDVGFRLWQLLSEALGQKVSKSNVKAVLGRYARHQSEAGIPQGDHPFSSNVLPLEFEFPTGPVPLQSRLYIERQPIEAQTFADVLKPGSLIRLKAPCQMGKTSLLRRILAHAHNHQIHSVTLSFHRADRAIYQSLDQFLRWFCANVSYQLGLEPNVNGFWNTEIGSKVSCSAYLEDYVLSQIDGSLAIALDELNEVFQYPEISSEFLPLLRSWYEDAREYETWGRIRWVLSHTTDVYVPLQLNQSPFNVGLAIRLPSFSLEQVQELALKHNITWAAGNTGIEYLVSLLHMISCRPGLVRLALYYLSRGGLSLDQLLEEAPTQSGIYSNHLRELLAALYPHPTLQDAFRRVLSASEPIALEPITAYRLESLGLITLDKNLAHPSCELYRQYFLNFLPTDQPSTYV